MSVLFATGFETGDFSAFDLVSPSGLYQYRVQSHTVHSGRYAAQLDIRQTWWSRLLGLPDSGVRLAWHNRSQAEAGQRDNLPDEAMYSAWYYLPVLPKVTWLNLMQWKQTRLLGSDDATRDPVISLSACTVNDRLWLQLKSFAQEGVYAPGSTTLAVGQTPLPIGRWFQLRVFYCWSMTPQGRVAAWLDDEPLWDARDICSELITPYIVAPRQFTVNNYGDAANLTLYLDDVLVETV